MFNLVLRDDPNSISPPFTPNFKRSNSSQGCLCFTFLSASTYRFVTSKVPNSDSMESCRLDFLFQAHCTSHWQPSLWLFWIFNLLSSQSPHAIILDWIGIPETVSPHLTSSESKWHHAYGHRNPSLRKGLIQSQRLEPDSPRRFPHLIKDFLWFYIVYNHGRFPMLNQLPPSYFIRLNKHTSQLSNKDTWPPTHMWPIHLKWLELN